MRVLVDKGRGSFGRRLTDWEIKGVPVRIEVGPRDLAQGVVAMARRDSGAKVTLAIESLATQVPDLLEEIQGLMFEGALSFRDGLTRDVSSIPEAVEAAQDGFARLAWDLVGAEGEAVLRADAITVRCLQRADGTMPVSDDESGLICIVSKSY